MAYCIRNVEWLNDADLEQQIKLLVLQNFWRAEILDFLKRDFPHYAWNLGALSRRMKRFGIKYVDYEAPINEVRDALAYENKGPGQLLGYRAVHQKIRSSMVLQFRAGLCTMS